MTHSVLSTEALQSYIEDLRKAKAEGRNLLTEKYACIDNLVPPLKTNVIIDGVPAKTLFTQALLQLTFGPDPFQPIDRPI